MNNIPSIKNWKEDLDKSLEEKTQSEEDIIGIMQLCNKTLSDINPVSEFVNDQQRYVHSLLSQYDNLYYTRFGKRLETQVEVEDSKENTLDTPEARKKAVRETALDISTPGNEISDKDILKALEDKGLTLKSGNPPATVSKIMSGIKPQFMKVEGKMGVYRRMITEDK